MKRFIILFLAILLLPYKALALSADELQQVQYDAVYYSSSSTNGGGSGGCGGGATLAGVSGGGIWNSGLSPQFIVEQYAIEVLKDLAAKEKHPASDTVTQEHVLALVTWARMEGGDIENSSLFNLWNTGVSAPELISGPHTGDGLGSYKSFDAGVEASARDLAGSHHTGMAAVLINPTSTAKDFAHAESYTGTSSYPGTLEWAAGALANPAAYESKWAGFLAQVQRDYKNTAALVIGTPAHEQSINLIEPSKLQFNGGAPNLAGGSPTSACGSSNSIAAEAIKESWPDSSHGTTPKPEYLAALNQYNKGGSATPADCGIFVATVMHASGADTAYPASGTGTQLKYANDHPEKYITIPVKPGMSINDLKPGDVLIVGGLGGSGGAGHTWIYVGIQPNGDYSASASLGTRAANLDKGDLVDSRGAYTIVRLK